MKQRVEKIVGDVAQEMWMGTFHSICVRILRKFIDRIGFNTDFDIFDTSDQRTLIKECLKTLKIDDKLFTDRGTLSEISNAKNEMLEPKAYSVKYSGDFRKALAREEERPDRPLSLTSHDPPRKVHRLRLEAHGSRRRRALSPLYVGEAHYVRRA